MTREDKCLLAIEKGFTYNPETGKVYGIRGKECINLRKDGYGLMIFQIDKKRYNLLTHHFAWYYIYKNCHFEQLDHINGIRNDNRIKNLRTVNSQQNHFNRHFTKNDIRVKGFTYIIKKNKFRSSITINKKFIYLGYFDTEQEARDAYLKAKEKYHVI
jgi:hypothetical protein